MKTDKNQEQAEVQNKKPNKYNLIKKFGLWGFIFFLAKGLVWLGLFLGIGSIFA